MVSGSGRSPREGNGYYPLQYYFLEQNNVWNKIFVLMLLLLVLKQLYIYFSAAGAIEFNDALQLVRENLHPNDWDFILPLPHI